MIPFWIKNRTESYIRHIKAQWLSAFFPFYIVTEYPKCGGNWFSWMLSDYLRAPFQGTKLQKITTPLVQGHHLYNPHMKNVFVVLRDGRDVMVSYYYYCLFAIPHNNEPLVERERKNLRFKDYDDIRENLPRFIEFKFTSPQKSLHTTARFTYTDFVNNWAGRDAAFVKYENLLADPVEEMSRAVRTVLEIEPDRERLKKIVEKYTFDNMSKRKPGQENRHSFFRKGVAGDWKNHFSRESREVFDRYGGDTLIRLGYEKDRSWVNAEE